MRTKNVLICVLIDLNACHAGNQTKSIQAYNGNISFLLTVWEAMFMCHDNVNWHLRKHGEKPWPHGLSLVPLTWHILQFTS